MLSINNLNLIRKININSLKDKNKGDKAAEEKFKSISAAYNVLSDEKQKQVHLFQNLFPLFTLYFQFSLYLIIFSA